MEKRMFDVAAKNIILLRHGDFDSSSENIDFYGFMQAMFVAKYLRNNKFPIPTAFIASNEKRTVQMSKIISVSLTKNNLPIFQEQMIYRDAIFGIENVVENPKNNLNDSNFIISVSHQPGLESSLKRLMTDRDYKTDRVGLAETFLLKSSTWKDMFSLNNKPQVQSLISPEKIRYFNKPGIKEIEKSFKETFVGGEIEKIPALLERLRNSQEMRNSMIKILNLAVNGQ